MRRFATLLVACGLVMVAGSLWAEEITLGSVDGGMVGDKVVSAEATFIVNGGGDSMTIILRNTGTADNYSMAQVLTDVSFNMEGATITGGDVKVMGGSQLLSPEDGGGTRTVIGGSNYDVSGEWGYAADTTIQGIEFDYSISASSLGDFTSGDNVIFDPNGNIEPSSAKLNGGDFGLINEESLGYDGIPNEHMIVNAVRITLTGSGFSLAMLDNVHFSYGSAHALVPVPEPASIALLGLGLLGAAGAARRRLRK